MAVRPEIAQQTQGVNVLSALQGGQQVAEQIKTQGIREAMLNQQLGASVLENQLLQQRQQAQNLQIQQARAQQTEAQSLVLNQLFKELRAAPPEQRAGIAARATPSLQGFGIGPDVIGQLGVSDDELEKGIAATSAFTQQRQRVQPAGAQEFEFLTQGLSEEDKIKAQRIKLGLEARAITSAPKVEEIGGVKYLRVGTQFFNPTTLDPIDVDPSTNLPVGAPASAQPTQEVLTPDVQRQSKAETSAAVTKAVEEVKQEIRGKDPEKVEQARKSNQATMDTVRTIDELLGSNRLDDITGVKGSLFTVRPKTKDLLNTATQLSSLLTRENLDVMAGVLSESDMGIIRGISQDLGFKLNDKNEVVGFSGSFDGTVKKMKRIRNTIISGLNSKSIYVEGQTATSADGRTLTYVNGQWVDTTGDSSQ